jgi:hypothetical protein
MFSSTNPTIRQQALPPEKYERRTMLELRPSCENCNTPLPPDSLEARICSYECTFCATCVDSVLDNVCPNCGGGFAPRPVRPSTNWKGDNFLGKDPASEQIKHRPVDAATHAAFSAAIRAIAPEDR